MVSSIQRLKQFLGESTHLVRIDDRVVVHILVVGQPDRFTVRLIAALKDVDRLAIVVVHLDRTVEHLAHRLNLNVITVTIV